MISNDLERVALRRLRHEEPRVNGTATGHTDPQQCRKLRLAARIECFVYEQGSTVEVMDSTCSIPATTAYPSTQGWIRVAPTSSHVASTGHYDVEWEVEFTDGTFATWPNATMEELIIARDLKRT